MGPFRFTHDTSPTSGDPTIPNRIDSPNIWSGGPLQIGRFQQLRTTVKATVSHYERVALGGSRMADGGQLIAESITRSPSFQLRELCLPKRSVEAADPAGARNSEAGS